MPFFDDVSMKNDDPIFKLNAAYAADSSPIKVNLGIGVYRTADSNSLVLSCVKKMEPKISIKKDYLPINGDPVFRQCSKALVFGMSRAKEEDGRIYTAQSVGGTGALRVAGEFLSQEVGKIIYIPDPTWINHIGVFSRCGMDIRTYPHWNNESHGMYFDGLCKVVEEMPSGSIMLLHGCCHNPTGIDPSHEQWKELSAMLKERDIFPLFDFAYQGFGEGVEEDAWAIRYFVDQGHECIVASSNSKNFGLYGERVGALSFVCSDEDAAQRIATQVKSIIRTNYSNPPRHGAALVAAILSSPQMYDEWCRELGDMRGRVGEMRKAFVSELQAKGGGRDFSFLSDQRGLFSFCPISEDRVARLIAEYGIYMSKNGRINVAGLTWENLDYVVEAMLSVL